VVTVAVVAFMVLPPATDPQTVEEVAPPLVGQVIREMEADDRARLLGDGSDEGRELCMKALHGLPEATLVIMEPSGLPRLGA
jgi:hypothetical protein